MSWKFLETWLPCQVLRQYNSRIVFQSVLLLLPAAITKSPKSKRHFWSYTEKFITPFAIMQSKQNFSDFLTI